MPLYLNIISPELSQTPWFLRSLKYSPWVNRQPIHTDSEMEMRHCSRRHIACSSDTTHNTTSGNLLTYIDIKLRQVRINCTHTVTMVNSYNSSITTNTMKRPIDRPSTSRSYRSSRQAEHIDSTVCATRSALKFAATLVHHPTDSICSRPKQWLLAQSSGCAANWRQRLSSYASCPFYSSGIYC